MLVVAQTKDASEAGLHPFVYGKTKQALAKFPKPELAQLSSKILDLWQTSHGGGMEIDLALEQFILGI